MTVSCNRTYSKPLCGHLTDSIFGESLTSLGNGQAPLTKQEFCKYRGQGYLVNAVKFQHRVSECFELAILEITFIYICIFFLSFLSSILSFIITKVKHANNTEAQNNENNPLPFPPAISYILTDIFIINLHFNRSVAHAICFTVICHRFLQKMHREVSPTHPDVESVHDSFISSYFIV